VERRGLLETHPNPFRKTEELTALIERFVVPLGKRVDAAQPYIDGRLHDGSRFHVMLSPIALCGPLISIRKFSDQTRVRLEHSAAPLIDWLRAAVVGRRNILVVGGTGAGKLRC